MKIKKNFKSLTNYLIKKGYKNIPNQPRHFVNKDGRVVSIVSGKIKEMVLVSNNRKHPEKGYYFFRIYKGSPIYVHKLVYTLFKGSIPVGYQVHHISGITSENNIENLTLLTKVEHLKLTWRKRKQERGK